MRYEDTLRSAVKRYWLTRNKQALAQGKGGHKDYGNRSAVTGGKQADGFAEWIQSIIDDCNVSGIEVSISKNITIPGFYRPSKDWDIVIYGPRHEIIGIIEIKTQSGSFGNNFNNRVEEALGSATDALAAYREGLFAPGTKPWMGYFLMVEECSDSLKEQRYKELPFFHLDDVFQKQSYIGRYSIFCERIVRDRLYDTACFITSEKGSDSYHEPLEEMSVQNFVRKLRAQILSFDA